MKNTFRDWLMQFEEQDNAYGDLVRDTLRMEGIKGKQIESCEELKMWIPSGCNDAMKTADVLVDMYHGNKKNLEIFNEKRREYGDETVARGLAYLFRNEKVKIKREDVPKFLEELGVEIIK